MPVSRVHVSVRGVVQGVFFRSSARERALTLGIKGWIKNRGDGSVEAVFEGKKDAVEKILDWCKKGPSGAIVEDMDIHWEEHTGEFDDFSIIY
ncbi:MAG: acylphosphatase [wastewater metagenome]|nr:acylphosphatase [Candidatus Loosdrechtia aerotolerans]